MWTFILIFSSPFSLPFRFLSIYRPLKLAQRSQRRKTQRQTENQMILTKTNCPVLLNPIPFFIKIKKKFTRTYWKAGSLSFSFKNKCLYWNCMKMRWIEFNQKHTINYNMKVWNKKSFKFAISTKLSDNSFSYAPHFIHASRICSYKCVEQYVDILMLLRANWMKIISKWKLKYFCVWKKAKFMTPC